MSPQREGANVTFMYRWKIPAALQSNFQAEWRELTQNNISAFGLISAVLYSVGVDEFVSVTEWPDRESWQKWKEQLADHPSRVCWRNYQISGPETLEALTIVQQR